MPKLVRNIVGVIYDPETAEIRYVRNVEGQFGEGDYFNVLRLYVYQQDYSRVEAPLVNIPKNTSFGLLSNNNRKIIDLEVSY
jgi:hypothetical protein|tara:strand:- start:1285 stop:1530 length:246 start_codon:yes stop_codon:yes gene_type:complete